MDWMRREFVPFDETTVGSELDALSARDRANIAALMDRYEDSPIRPLRPILVEDYSGGLRCLRDESASYQGRCLFFVAEAKKGYQKLVILTVYKKEKTELPTRIRERALARMRKWKEEAGSER